MKYRMLKIAAILLCGFLALSAAYKNNIQSELSDTVVRLHILAEDDSTEAQTLKLKVRDAILAEYGTYLSGMTDKSQALSALQALLPDILRTASEVTTREGQGENVSASLETAYFPTKTYGDYTFPAGEYDALRLVIGAGNGQNWWCVVYPPLCFSDLCSGPVPASSEELLKSQLTEHTYRAIALPDQPIIGFRILKWFRDLCEEITQIV